MSSLSESKSTFELEPNPFERSFATKESTESLDNQVSENGSDASGVRAASASSTNKHNLHIPNISSLNQNGKLPAMTPPMFTPGGRRLPPLLSPGAAAAATNGSSYSNPGTPGSALWNNLLANNNNQQQQQQQSQGVGINSNGYNQFGRKTGLTPNESSMRTGLTPGGLSHFPFGSQLAVPGLSTPGALLNGPITPGLSSLLGFTPGGVQGSHLTAILPPVHGNGNNGNNNQPPQVLQPQPVIHEEPYSVAPPPVIPQIPPTSVSAPPMAPITLPPKIQQNQQQQQQLEEQQPIPAIPTPPGQRVEIKVENGKRTGEDLNETSPVPKKKSNRGRRPGSGKKSTSQPKEESGSPADSHADDDKRKNFLERNRVAASKCRQRKKQLVQKMEEELEFYSNGYRELSAQVTQLHEQLLNLRAIVSGHKDCTLLAQSVGGFEALNDIVNQADLAIQISSGVQTNMTSMPSTIPTNLNTTNIQQQMSKDPIPRDANTVTPELYSNNTATMVNNNSNIASHHSLTDLRASAAQSILLRENGTANGGINTNNDLRAINSMSNLTAMNQRQFV
ncbi:Transcriptional regulator SKO1 [Spathaspora sp. JA1]|nr:Transcriptional regulator SKO1 [Spathaspora sp. JA1]